MWLSTRISCRGGRLSLALLFSAFLLQVGLHGEDNPASSKAVKPSNQEISDLLKQFNEVSLKVRQTSEMRDLNAKIEEAQKAYAEAYERAIEKEAPQLLNKIRSLQREKIQALHKSRQIFPEEFPEDLKLSPEDRSKLQKARSLAFKEANVIHCRLKMNSAANARDRDKAETEYQKVLLDAMRRIDPDIDKILKKIEPSETAVKSASMKN